MGRGEVLFKCCYLPSDASCISNNPLNMSHLPSCLVARLSFRKQAEVKSGRWKSAVCDVARQGRHSLDARLGLCDDPWEFSILLKSLQQNLCRWWAVSTSSCSVLGRQGGLLVIKGHPCQTDAEPLQRCHCTTITKWTHKVGLLQPQFATASPKIACFLLYLLAYELLAYKSTNLQSMFSCVVIRWNT